MFYCLKVPVVYSQPLTEEELKEQGHHCDNYGNYECIFVYCEKNNIKTTIEDVLNVIRARDNNDGTWTLTGCDEFDQVNGVFGKSRFNENRSITIAVDELGDDDMKKFFSNPKAVLPMDLNTYVW